MITTLLDAQLYSREELAAAYRARWHAELDLRSIKQVMQMDVLRCKARTVTVPGASVAVAVHAKAEWFEAE